MLDLFWLYEADPKGIFEDEFKEKEDILIETFSEEIELLLLDLKCLVLTLAVSFDETKILSVIIEKPDTIGFEFVIKPEKLITPSEQKECFLLENTSST